MEESSDEPRAQPQDDEERSERQPNDEDEGGRPDDEEESEAEAALSGLARRTEAELRPFQGGRTVRVLGGELPVRGLKALAVFLGAFMVVWLALWVVLGDIGFGLGWIFAAAAGVVAVRVYGHRLEGPQGETTLETRQRGPEPPAERRT